MFKKCTLILALGLVFWNSAAAGQDPDHLATVEVSETATLSVAPNMAKILFAVESNSDRAQIAVRENAQQTARLLAALQKTGTDEDSIETTGIQLAPFYSKNDDGRPKSYRVSNTVVLTTKNLNDLGAYIDASSAAGASRIGNLIFGTDQETLLQKKAAVNAVRQGLETARDLARAAGLNIKRVVEINYSPVKPFPRIAGLARAESVRTPIEIGQITIEATVQMVFELN